MHFMKNIKSIFIVFFLVASFNQMKAQDSLTINLAAIGIIEGAVEQMTQNILVSVINNYAQERNVYFTVAIRGALVDGTVVDIDNRTSAPDYIVNIPAAGFSFTLKQLIEQFQNSTIEDYEFNPPSFLNTLQTTRQLPAGDYRICLEARNLNNQLMSAAGANNCLDFTISYRNPPIIQSPANNTWLEFSEMNEINVMWSHDHLGSPTTYNLEIRRFPTQQAANDFLESGSPQNVFETSTERVLYEEGISAWTFNTLSAEDEMPVLEAGDILAVRVTAVSSSSLFLNSGQSNIHVFIYGVPEGEVCNNPSLIADWAFPSVGDTLPFTDIFPVARFEPSCDNILEMHADIHFSRSASGVFVGSNTDRNYDDNWRSGPGPSNYLRNYFQRHFPSNLDFFYPTGSEYEQYLPFMHNDGLFNAQRGEEVRIYGGLTFTKNVIPGNTTNTQSLSLNAMNSHGIIIGMPRPQLQNPPNDAVVAPGNIQFDFSTGLEPGNPLPPFKIFKLEGFSDPIVPGLSVNEKCVLQLSKDRSFHKDSIVFCQLKKIQGNPYNNANNFNVDNPNFEPISNTFDLTPQRQFDQPHFIEQVYRDLSVSTNFDQEDTLYWRVIWLKHPEAYNITSPCGSGIDITPEDFYHSSPVRRLFINNDGVVDVSSTSDETQFCAFMYEEDLEISAGGNVECERLCNTPPLPESERVAVSGISVGDNIEVGNYSFTISSITGSGSTYSGEGILRLNSNIQLNVTFSEARINADRKMFEGTVNAESENRSDFPRTNSTEMAAIVDGISELRRLTEAFSGAPTSLPLGIDFTAGSELRIVAALDKATFTPTGARACYLAGVKLPEEMDGLSLLFAADNVCLNPTAVLEQVFISWQPISMLHWTMVGPLVFPEAEILQPLLMLNLIAMDSRHWHSEEDWSSAEMLWYRKTLQPVPLKPVRLQLFLELKLIEMPNFSIGLTFDKPFQFTEVPKFGFTVTSAILDFSESENYSGMRFPELYDIHRLPPLAPDSGPASSAELRLRNSWTGFYLRELSLRLPKDLATTRPGIGIGDVMIDPTGVSFEIRATGVWSSPQESDHGYFSFFGHLGLLAWCKVGLVMDVYQEA